MQMTKTIFNRSGVLVVEDFLKNAPLYEEYDISYVPVKTIRLIEYYQGTIDAYCVECKQIATFQSIVVRPPNYSGQSEITLPDPEEETLHSARIFCVQMCCTRNSSHQIAFFFRVIDGKLLKVGQFPSMADFRIGDSKKYKSILTVEERKGFSRAIGLHAHGIGIGAFVYLRRIFENLVERAHAQAMQSPLWNETAFDKVRMHEKIKLLKDFLPEIVVKNADIYSILSMGLHSLREEDCLTYFETIRAGIELILSSELDRREKEKQSKLLTNEVAKIKRKLGN